MQKSHEYLDHQCIGQSSPPEFKLEDLNTCNANHQGRLRCSILINLPPIAAPRAPQTVHQKPSARSQAGGIRPTGLLKSLGEPDRAGIKEIYRSPDLSILNVVWAPRMMVMPHNHHMWAVIGVYGGREDNIFWRRIAEAGENQLEAAGARSIAVREAQPLGDDIIHSVANPTSKFTAAIHVYGGDFFAAHRSEWDPDTLSDILSDGNRARQIFEEANRRYAAGLG